MRKQFENLVEALCALKNLGDAKSYIEGAPINVNGTKCALLYRGDPFPDRFFLYVVFGYAPHDREEEAFKMLLQQNQLGFEGRGPGFCLSATTGKVGHVVSIALNETSADQLASSMVYYANKAADWRETLFLNKELAANSES